MSAGAKRSIIPDSYLPLNGWPAPDVSVIEPKKRDLYEARRLAVSMYADGAPFDLILATTRIQAAEVRRLVGRCVASGGDGQIQGFYGLIPGTHIVPYIRTTPVVHIRSGGNGGCSGAFSALMRDFPDLRDWLTSRFLPKRTGGEMPAIRIPYFQLHGEFMDELRKLGFQETDWPLCTGDTAYQSMRRFCLSLLNADADLWIRVRSGKDAQWRRRVGTGVHGALPVLRPFTACQLDFHKVDGLGIVEIENEFNVMIPVVLPRVQFGALVEERHGLVIGGFVALELNPSGDSVLEVIDSALRPLSTDAADPRSLVIDLAGVFPNQFIPFLQYQCFGILKMDNAWSNGASGVVRNIIDTIGCAVNFGPVRAWWRRNLVESTFNALTSRGMKLLPSTVGGHPQDPIKDCPAEKAVAFKITLSDICEIWCRAIREQNEVRREKTGFATPLEACGAAIKNPKSGLLHQPLPRAVREEVRLMRQTVTAIVHGSSKRGVNPYVVLGRWRFTNPEMAKRYALIGEKIIAHIDRRDKRRATATVLSTGEYLGELVPPAGHRDTCISWRHDALIAKGGISARKHENTTSAVGIWQRSKQEKIMARQRRGGGKTKQSKDAMALVNQLSAQERAAARNPRPLPPEPEAEVRSVETLVSNGRLGLDIEPADDPFYTEE